MIKINRDLHPKTSDIKSRKRKRAAMEALNRITSTELDRKDGLMSPVKELALREADTDARA